MSSTLSYKELAAMSAQDLERDVAQQRKLVQKMRINISMNTDKDSAKYRRERKALARMLTALSGKKAGMVKEPLSSAAKSSTVSAPATAKKKAASKGHRKAS